VVEPLFDVHNRRLGDYRLRLMKTMGIRLGLLWVGIRLRLLWVSIRRMLLWMGIPLRLLLLVVGVRLEETGIGPLRVDATHDLYLNLYISYWMGVEM